jgi:septal ring factor EnvC (AmiA/AmiB activator)
MSQPAQCSHCGKPLVVVIETDDEALLARLDRMERLIQQQSRDLAAIKRALGIIHHEQEHDMAELDDRLAEIAADEDAEHAQLARLIADFEDAPGADLSDAQRQVLDQIKSHIVGDTTAITDADPEPTPEPAPGDGGTEPAPAE